MSITTINSTAFSFSEAQLVTRPLVFFVIGIFLYAIFIFKFYRFLARRDIFKLNLQKYSESFVGLLEKFFSTLLYILEYIIIFPLFIFFWFGIIAVILSLMSKNHTISQILLISMALVAAVRITAYYSEELSKDLAKMFPFALLGVFLIDITQFSLPAAIETIKQFPTLWKQMIYYLGFAIALELVLRVFFGVFVRPFKDDETKNLNSSN